MNVIRPPFMVQLTTMDVSIAKAVAMDRAATNIMGGAPHNAGQLVSQALAWVAVCKAMRRYPSASMPFTSSPPRPDTYDVTVNVALVVLDEAYVFHKSQAGDNSVVVFVEEEGFQQHLIGWVWSSRENFQKWESTASGYASVPPLQLKPMLELFNHIK